MPREKAVQACENYINHIFDFFRTSNETYLGMHLRDLQVLYYILSEHEEQRVTVSELASHLNITAAAASQVISGYEKKGWIIRVRSTTDRRTVYLQVEPKLLEELRKDWKRFDKNLEKEFVSVSKEELEGFAKVMDIIIKSFDTTHPYFG